MEVEIYTVKKCEKCKMIKQYLRIKEIEFTEYDMGVGGNVVLQEMKKQFKEMGLKTYPVTLIKDTKIILQGFDKKEFDEVFGDANQISF